MGVRFWKRFLGLLSQARARPRSSKTEDGVVEDADETGELVGLIAGERLAAGAAVLEGACGDDDVIEIAEREPGGFGEGGERGGRDAGLYLRETEAEFGEVRPSGQRLGGDGHRDIMP